MSYCYILHIICVFTELNNCETLKIKLQPLTRGENTL